MKKIVRGYLLLLLSVYFTAKLKVGLSYNEDLRLLASAGLLISVLDMTVRPILSLVTLPLQILTLGLFSLVVNAAGLYLTTLLLPGFRVQSFSLPPLQIFEFNFPEFYSPAWLSFILVSFLLNLFRSFLKFLCRK